MAPTNPPSSKKRPFLLKTAYASPGTVLPPEPVTTLVRHHTAGTRKQPSGPHERTTPNSGETAIHAFDTHPVHRMRGDTPPHEPDRMRAKSSRVRMIANPELPRNENLLQGDEKMVISFQPGRIANDHACGTRIPRRVRRTTGAPFRKRPESCRKNAVVPDDEPVGGPPGTVSAPSRKRDLGKRSPLPAGAAHKEVRAGHNRTFVTRTSRKTKSGWRERRSDVFGGALPTPPSRTREVWGGLQEGVSEGSSSRRPRGGSGWRRQPVFAKSRAGYQKGCPRPSQFAGDRASETRIPRRVRGLPGPLFENTTHPVTKTRLCPTTSPLSGRVARWAPLPENATWGNAARSPPMRRARGHVPGTTAFS